MVKLLRQVNLARSLRNAGWLYVEITFGRGRALFDYSSAELDRQAIDSEHFFRRRYGFVAREGERAQIVALQRRYRLCDWEICRLKRTNNLRRSADGTWQLWPDRWGLWLGVVSIAVVLLTLFALIAMILTSGVPPLRRLVGILLLTLILGGSCVFYARTTILPWRILRERGVTAPPLRRMSSRNASEP